MDGAARARRVRPVVGLGWTRMAVAGRPRELQPRLMREKMRLELGPGDSALTRDALEVMTPNNKTFDINHL